MISLHRGVAKVAPAPTPPVPPPTSAPIPVPPPTSAPTPVPPPTGGDGCHIEGYELWDGDTGLVDADLTSGQTICNPLFSNGNSIRVVAPACDFVELDLRGPDHSSRTERAEPFFLFGDRRGDPRTRILSVGSYSLEAVGDSVAAAEALAASDANIEVRAGSYIDSQLASFVGGGKME